MEDTCHLQKLGKNHLYLIDLDEDEIHENQAAAILAKGLAGQGVEWRDDPKEGKIGLHAAFDGLLSVDTAALAAFNMVDEVMCATLHSHTLVNKDELVAATRADPAGHETSAYRTRRRNRKAERRRGLRQGVA